MFLVLQSRRREKQPTASSLRVVGVKATPAGRAPMTSRDRRARRGLDAAEWTRTAERVAAPEIVAQNYGPPEIQLRNFRVIAAPKPDLRSDARVIQCVYASMQKDFDRWNKVKKAINGAAEDARL